MKNDYLIDLRKGRKIKKERKKANQKTHSHTQGRYLFLLCPEFDVCNQKEKNTKASLLNYFTHPTVVCKIVQEIRIKQDPSDT